MLSKACEEIAVKAAHWFVRVSTKISRANRAAVVQTRTEVGFGTESSPSNRTETGTEIGIGGGGISETGIGNGEGEEEGRRSGLV